MWWCNKMKLKNIIKLVITMIVLILSIICFKYIFDLNVLPDKYLLLFGSIMLILNILYQYHSKFAFEK